MSRMRIIDAHCHATPDWHEPVEALLFQMERHGVEQAVLIQINGQYGNVKADFARVTEHFHP